MKYAVTLEKTLRAVVYITVEGGPEAAMKHAMYSELYGGGAGSTVWRERELFTKDVEECDV